MSKCGVLRTSNFRFLYWTLFWPKYCACAGAAMPRSTSDHATIPAPKRQGNLLIRTLPRFRTFPPQCKRGTRDESWIVKLAVYTPVVRWPLVETVAGTYKTVRGGAFIPAAVERRTLNDNSLMATPY